MPLSMSAADCDSLRDSRWADGSYFQQLCAFIYSFMPNFLKRQTEKRCKLLIMTQGTQWVLVICYAEMLLNQREEGNRLGWREPQSSPHTV